GERRASGAFHADRRRRRGGVAPARLGRWRATVLTVEREERGSDVPFVAAVTRVRYGTACHDVTTPDGLWDIVIQRHAGKVTVLQTGLITSPVALDYLEGDEYLSISFRPGVFMPRLPGVRMVDKAVFRPLTSRRAFALDSE